MLTKSGLAIALSKLSVFDSPKMFAEQYATDSEAAAEILWNATMNGDIEGKVIADFGAGTGILGIGALLLGAKKVFFIDNDEAALKIAADNLKKLQLKNFEILDRDISKVKLQADVVIQNPPFGTKTAHIDREFLAKAFDTASVIYSFHKSSTKRFVESFSRDSSFSITHVYEILLPLKRQHAFHTRRIHRIEVACFRLQQS